LPQLSLGMAISKIPNLQRLRSERRLTQPQLADALGISKRTILRWEAGEGEPATSDLIALSRYFGVSIDQLVAELVTAETPQALPKVSELAGAQLDYWVAKVQGMTVELTPDGPVLYEPGYGQRPVPRFSSDLSLANSLMQSKGVQLQSVPAGTSFDAVPRTVQGWVARCLDSPIACWGVTIPEAGMRAFLSSVVGSHVLG
jgi:transcriptional regulator with XRE-family HTH domain